MIDDHDPIDDLTEKDILWEIYLETKKTREHVYALLFLVAFPYIVGGALYFYARWVA